MKSAALYITTVLIWGSTWLAIEFQLGDIAVELSLFYRFAIAALLMWLYVAYKKPDMRFKLLDHGFFVLLAICNFGLNSSSKAFSVSNSSEQTSEGCSGPHKNLYAKF